MGQVTLFKWLRCVAMGLLVLGAQLPAVAHKPSDSYLTLTVRDGGRIDVLWHVALRDLDSELALDANDDGRLTWGEVRTRWADMQRFVSPHLRLQREGQACAVMDDVSAGAPALIEHTDGQYAVLAWSQRCEVPVGQAWAGVQMDYSLFALSDPTHRGIVRWRRLEGEVRAGGLSATGNPVRELGVVVLGVGRSSHTQAWRAQTEPVDGATVSLGAVVGGGTASTPSAAIAASDASDRPSAWAQVGRTVRDGVEHIAAGTDHILFVVLLLLVSVWQRPMARASRRPLQGWQARATWGSSLGEVLRLVTAFTVAHSITLGLAAFGVLSPPSRWVESLIALSVLAAAIDNLWPILRAPRWAVVFGFGLVHGFGFAGAMQDLGLSSTDLAWPLLGFNLGVELGQLMLVAVVLPLSFALRRTRFYRRWVVLPGSVAIGAMALVWFTERSLDTVILGWGG
jgi:HupE / UreJ protein